MARAVAKEKLPRSSSADRCALDNEVPAFMFRPISAPACELLSPTPADASFQSKDTDKIMHPDLKNDRSSLDDEVTFFMCPSDVPLPPRPPPTAEVGLCRKRRYSTAFSVNDEEEHLMPKRMRLMSSDVPVSSNPPPADASFHAKDTDKIIHPDLKNDGSSLDDDVTFFMCPRDVPLPPRPPPTAETRGLSYLSAPSKAIHHHRSIIMTLTSVPFCCLLKSQYLQVLPLLEF
ncbi:uncharacterized protein LOC113016556 [Astatotilapia calliptera]|uniref:uncharacterized protein LOC113016556 n=1 Tax=Astatotilapia calliptera TaxID=8154 RepID=UPI000E41CECC|nr:uncharacterized protein LOC113016556 [Astatotilapia calliptera]